MSSKSNSKRSKHSAASSSTTRRSSARHLSSSSQRLSRHRRSNRVKSHLDSTPNATTNQSPWPRLQTNQNNGPLHVYKTSTYEDLAVQCETIIDNAHEKIERLFLITYLQNFSVDNDEQICLNYTDFSNCFSREMTPPISPKTYQPQQTRTPFSTPTSSIKEGPHTPTSDFETSKNDGKITQPPNTPNLDLFFAAPCNECKASPVNREDTAKAAALCLLKGMGLFGQKMRHRSPAQSLRLKSTLNENMLEEDHTAEEIVPVKKESLVTFPKAYRVKQRKSATKSDTSEETSNTTEGSKSKVKSNAALSVTELENGMEITLKLTLNVGEYTTKPANVVFKCSGSDNRPVDVTLNGVSGWNDKQGPIATKKI
ncbi:unnamed protein product [Bursaphelenchus okinawaensis]|uniref:Uncharacterized protein n=1 Tax=Bursaphelenchus okinawaensis TaxID=465554 RepID=A0A811L3F0_9BILA|nr:unnamed protein product [Bursaphelenchus okinawaensis]CAG9115629.1 unnamed protein product [Bursaphelenchus okinawaensis]